MTLHCAVLDDYQNAAFTLTDWSPVKDKVTVKVFRQHFQNERDLIYAISDCSIVVLMRERTAFGRSLFSSLPKLKLLLTTGMRNASIDLAAAAAHGVTVCGTGSLSQPPVELTWALILGLARRIVQENHSLATNGIWQSSIGVDLYGKQLGLLGLGKIGSAVARIGMAFGMQVIAWSQNLTRERADSVGVQFASSKEHLLQGSDFVSIHLILSERTRNLIGTQEFKFMRPSSYLINTSRAQIVNQMALIEALSKGYIAGAGVDVFETEPLPKDDVLRTLPNLLATPHLGYVTESNYRIYYREVVEDIQAFLAGTPIRKLT